MDPVFVDNRKPLDDEEKRRLLLHILALVGLFVPPLNLILPTIVWLCCKDKSPYIKEAGLEAMNFHLSIILYWLVLYFYSFIPNLAFVIIFVWLWALISSSVALYYAKKNRFYRYRFGLRLF